MNFIGMTAKDAGYTHEHLTSMTFSGLNRHDHILYVFDRSGRKRRFTNVQQLSKTPEKREKIIGEVGQKSLGRGTSAMVGNIQ